MIYAASLRGNILRFANSYFFNLAIRIQMSAYDLLSGTLTFLLFVILTPFVGAGRHAAYVSVYSAVRLARHRAPRRCKLSAHKNYSADTKGNILS